MKKNLSIVLITIAFQSCTLDNNEIKEVWWKCCGDEPVLRDFPTFSDENLRNDTVYIQTINNKDSAIAVIFETEKRWLADNLIYVRHLGTGAIGRYCEKGKLKN
jgi:hypothetical protein